MAGAGWRAGVATLLLLGASGCAKHDNYTDLITADFDSQPSGSRSLSKDRAHSGEFAAVATGPTDTLLLRYPAAVLSMAKQVRFGGQIWLARSPNRYPDLLVQVWRGGSPIYTKGLRLNEVVWRFERWVPISLLLELPDIQSKDELRVTLRLDKPATKVYFDDLTVEYVR